MRHVVVFAHPDPDSFIRRAAGAYIDELERCGHSVEARDLYTMRFDPVLSAGELAGDGPQPEDVRQEQALIETAQGIAFLFPVWWASMPAMLKGYVDRVFTHGFAWEMRDGRVEGKLHGRRGVFITSSAAPMDCLTASGELEAFTIAQDAVIMGLCGIHVTEHLHFDDLGPHTTTGRIGGCIARVRRTARGQA